MPPVKTNDTTGLDAICINTIRTLAMDAVQQANSGHPGSPMAMAPMAYVLWQQFLRFDPPDPIWPNRDRFVLSAGHASMLLYSLLHLTGVKAVIAYEVPGEPSVTLDDIKHFRQLDSKCPGHPEYRWTQRRRDDDRSARARLWRRASAWPSPAVGWPKTSIARISRCSTFDVYALCGDGCMMEGISGEAASLAGHLRLSNLCWIYDNNHITIEGNTSLAFSEDVATRFLGLRLERHSRRRRQRSGHAGRAFRKPLQNTTDRPTLIIVDSHIAYGAPKKQDTGAAHGEPLGEDEVRLTKRNYGWPEDAKFLVPDGVYEHFRNGIGKRGRDARDAWMTQFEEYKAAVSGTGRPTLRMQPPTAGRLGQGPARFPADAKGMASARLLGQGA